MDPPAFGIGKNKKRWKIEDKVEDLLATAYDCLEEKGFLIMNTYSPKIDQHQLEILGNKIVKHHKFNIFPLVQETKTGKYVEHNWVLKIT